MAVYQHILIAVDLTEDSEVVGHKACVLAEACNARLSLLHVVEYIPVDPAGEAMLPPPVNMEDELVKAARLRLDNLAKKLGISDCGRYVEIGNIKSELGRIATEQAIDLIVLGSRERCSVARAMGAGAHIRGLATVGQIFHRRTSLHEFEQGHGAGLFHRRGYQRHHYRSFQIPRFVRHRQQLHVCLQG